MYDITCTSFCYMIRLWSPGRTLTGAFRKPRPCQVATSRETEPRHVQAKLTSGPWHGANGSVYHENLHGHMAVSSPFSAMELGHTQLWDPHEYQMSLCPSLHMGRMLRGRGSYCESSFKPLKISSEERFGNSGTKPCVPATVVMRVIA